jgi:hypothetical protein
MSGWPLSWDQRVGDDPNFWDDILPRAQRMTREMQDQAAVSRVVESRRNKKVSRIIDGSALLALIIMMSGCGAPRLTVPAHRVTDWNQVKPGIVERTYGSGVVCNYAGRVIEMTAAHNILTGTGWIIAGDRDLAWRYAEADGRHVLTVGPPPKTGDRLTAVGYAKDDDDHTTVSGICTAPGVMSGVVQCGMSGGPVMDDRGRVVGIITYSVPSLGVSGFEDVGR